MSVSQPSQMSVSQPDAIMTTTQPILENANQDRTIDELTVGKETMGFVAENAKMHDVEYELDTDDDEYYHEDGDDTDDDEDENEDDEENESQEEGQTEGQALRTAEASTSTDKSVTTIVPHPEWREEQYASLPESHNVTELVQEVTLNHIKSLNLRRPSMPSAIQRVLGKFNPEALAAFCDLEGVKRFEFLRTVTDSCASTYLPLAILRHGSTVVVGYFSIDNMTMCHYDPFIKLKISKSGIWERMAYVMYGWCKYNPWGWKLSGGVADLRKQDLDEYEIREGISLVAASMIKNKIWKREGGVNLEYSFSKKGSTWNGGAKAKKRFEY